MVLTPSMWQNIMWSFVWRLEREKEPRGSRGSWFHASGALRKIVIDVSGVVMSFHKVPTSFLNAHIILRREDTLFI